MMKKQNVIRIRRFYYDEIYRKILDNACTSRQEVIEMALWKRLCRTGHEESKADLQGFIEPYV